MKKSSSKPSCDRWTPILRGLIYCSPGCGYDCTKAEHDLAHLNARTLCRHMGAGWTPNVWENLGWHYSVISPCGRIKIHPSEGKDPLGDACAYLNAPDSPGGRWVKHGTNPKAAVKNVIRVVKAESKGFETYLSIHLNL